MSDLKTLAAEQAETARKIAEAELPIIAAAHSLLLNAGPLVSKLSAEAEKLPDDHEMRTIIRNVISVMENGTSILFRRKRRLEAIEVPFADGGKV